MSKADIGLIGLAVMGRNLVMNMESEGYSVAVYNRTLARVKDFVEGRAKEKDHWHLLLGGTGAEPQKPCKVMLMVKAGQPVDSLIEQLIPLLEEETLSSTGQSHFPDTIRRTRLCRGKGFALCRHGVSGGRRRTLGTKPDARGSPAAWPHIKPIFQAIAAKVEDGNPCCEWV